MKDRCDAGGPSVWPQVSAQHSKTQAGKCQMPAGCICLPTHAQKHCQDVHTGVVVRGVLWNQALNGNSSKCI